MNQETQVGMICVNDNNNGIKDLNNLMALNW